MALSIPENLNEALAAGHTALEGDERDAALATFGSPDVGQDCSTWPPGHKCGETDCIDGFKLVLYCDNSKGCTVHVKVPC